ncbi:hypothetical protein D3C74_24930 [compost metagenome]
MEHSNIRDYVKQGLEVYYERYNYMIEDDFCRWMHPDVPDEMKVQDGTMSSDQDWARWRIIPSTVTQEDIAGLEQEFGLTFPTWYQAFISTYHHFFDIVPSQGVDDPLSDIRNMYNPVLCKLGYLPFAWDAEYGKIRCIDLSAAPDEDQCAVYEIEHEILFDLDELVAERNILQDHLVHLYPNFKAYFDHTFLESQPVTSR